MMGEPDRTGKISELQKIMSTGANPRLRRMMLSKQRKAIRLNFVDKAKQKADKRFKEREKMAS